MRDGNAGEGRGRNRRRQTRDDFIRNARGLEPSKTTTGPDKNCIYDERTVVIE